MEENIKSLKEIKDGSIIEIKISKTYYLMLKKVLYFIFKQNPDENITKELIKKVISNDNTSEHSEQESCFKTILVLLAEIEKEAANKNLYVDIELNINDLKNKLKSD